jgi:hypothetical protein
MKALYARRGSWGCGNTKVDRVTLDPFVVGGQSQTPHTAWSENDDSGIWYLRRLVKRTGLFLLLRGSRF